MSTTQSDLAMDVFMDNKFLYKMDKENLEDFLERTTIRLNSLIKVAD